ncbi:SOS response-associated peptidase family protein [Aromatoleum evansii]|uniref:SOS response-associated peptidase family protein n=1 Tax=Aromatoleum evansii TaxID=59406 RepID=A0ABZ1ASL6_AROEV|nr:SOS response-associated peptidase family protein [Aromatoleum evansii]
MPVILAPDTYAVWLDPKGDLVTLQARLSPCADDVLALHPVGKAVGNVRNEGLGLIDPK